MIILSLIIIINSLIKMAWWKQTNKLTQTMVGMKIDSR
jgi:hypothetical protein